MCSLAPIRTVAAFATLAVAATACSHSRASAPAQPTRPLASAQDLRDPREVHFGDLRQLTFGGENAEAYWSFDGKQLIFQSTHEPYACDQIFRMPVAGEPVASLVSTGKGRTTCSYFFPGDRHVLYASTHLAGNACPPAPDRSHGYTWALYDYDIFSARPDGTDLRRLTETPGYDAEATVCAKTGTILFTSTRDGDLELYRMDPDGKNVVRLTHTQGYDGGAFFSPDCSQIVWRASRPHPGKELDDYQQLLKQGLVRPTQLEIYVASADGSDARQVTYLGAASFGPAWFPSGDRIIFASNYGDPKGREFDLWAVNTDGTGLERITFTGGFDGFPMFSPDGSQLVFASNRHPVSGKPGETDVFLAHWVSPPPVPDRSDERAADRFAKDDAWLADDAREGRGVGTQGLEDAADFIARRFGDLGLAPAGDPGSFKQAFSVPVSVSAGPATAVAVDKTPLARAALEPAGFSASADASADVVVAGYGISAPELGSDDYKGVNAKGKVVLVRRFTPDGGRFEDRAQRRYSDPRYKAWNAREHGARALLIADLPVPEKDKPLPEEGALPTLTIDTLGDAGIPVVFLKREAAAALLTGRHRATVSVKLETDRKPVYNIVAKIPAGAPARLPGAVVIGAHYDHLGYGGPASLAPGVREIHNGADDNASGVAALLEVGRRLAARRAELRRDVYLVAFSAEELGILGSTQFTRSPPDGLKLADVVAMLNMDMVGRMRENRLQVLGGETAAEWKPLMAAACEHAHVECTVQGDGYGPSDHTPFYASGIPVLHFFTGAHRDYHRPTDDAPLVNAAGGAQVAGLVADLAFSVQGHDGKLSYQAARAPEPQGDLRDVGASLGTVPDYVGPPAGQTGVLLAGVRPGGPADLAGMKRGDILVGIDGHAIANVEDFMFVLQKSKPGAKGKVTILRDHVRMELEVTFGAGRRR